MTPAEVVGTWRYAFENPKVTITFTLSPDGTCSQKIVAADGSVMSQTGTWRLDVEESMIEFENILLYSARTWSVGTVFFPVVDSAGHRGSVAIAGGAFADPDNYKVFPKVE